MAVLEGNPLWIAIAGGALFLALLLFYLYLKDVEIGKRLRHFEKSIEELNKQLYKLQKKLKEEEAQSEQSNSMLLHSLHQEVREAVNNAAAGIYQSLEKSEALWLENKERTDEKLVMLEERIKEMGYFPTSPNGVDESRILSMFRDGWSIDAIAKELRIGKGEVEFTLKLANIN